MEQRDSEILNLFDASREELPATQFVAGVMSETDQQRHRQGLVWGGIGLVVVALFAVLVLSLGDAVALLTTSLNLSLFAIDNEFASLLLSPVNSIGFLLALGFLALRKLVRISRG